MPGVTPAKRWRPAPTVVSFREKLPVAAVQPLHPLRLRPGQCDYPGHFGRRRRDGKRDRARAQVTVDRIGQFEPIEHDHIDNRVLRIVRGVTHRHLEAEDVALRLEQRARQRDLLARLEAFVPLQRRHALAVDGHVDDVLVRCLLAVLVRFVNVGDTAEVQRRRDRGGRGAAAAQVRQVEFERERFRVGMGQLGPLPEVGFVARVHGHAAEPDQFVFLLEVHPPQQRAGNPARGGRRRAHARVRARLRRQNVYIHGRVRIEPALRPVQRLADPLQMRAGNQVAGAIADNAQGHFAATLGQHQVLAPAIGQARLRGDDGGLVQGIDSSLVQFDMNPAGAGMGVHGQNQSDERGAENLRSQAK